MPFLHFVFLLVVLKQENPSAIVFHAGHQQKPVGLLCNNITDGISLPLFQRNAYVAG